MRPLPWLVGGLLIAATARAQDRPDRERPRPPVRFGATTVTVIDENQSVEEVISRVRERTAREQRPGPDGKARSASPAEQRRGPGESKRVGGADRVRGAAADRVRNRERALERQRERRGGERRRVNERRELRRLGR